MRAADVIRRKRDGAELAPEEIQWVVDRYVRGDLPEAEVAALLMAIYFRGLTPRETAVLTRAMVVSGATLDLSRIQGRKVDKHSTGGVGDKTSLVLVPLLASVGVRVPKLSGRALGHTGGTLDKLESIPGFRCELGPEELADQVNRVGCAIASQSHHLVPADKLLYGLRDRTATVDSVPLIASSVMSKKLAVGSDAIVLDVKAGSGAFMKTPQEAAELARAMVSIGREVGRPTVALITRMDEPLGSAVGNALEVAEAIQALRGEGPPDLRELCLALGSAMAVLGEVASDLKGARALLESALADGWGLRKFAEMVAAQGGDPMVVDCPERLPQAPVQLPVAASADGVVEAIDTEAVGYAALTLGAGRVRPDDRVDPAAGVVVLRKVGETVRRGEPFAVLHTSDPRRAEDAARRIAASYRLGREVPPERPLILGIVEDQERRW